MTFDDIMEQALDMLRRRGRVSYRALKRQFDLDDDYLTDLKDELLYTQSDLVEDADRGLIWNDGSASERDLDTQSATDGETQFQTLLSAVVGWLQREQRAPYRALKYVFDIDDVSLAERRENLRFRQWAHDVNSQGLDWRSISSRSPYCVG